MSEACACRQRRGLLNHARGTEDPGRARSHRPGGRGNFHRGLMHSLGSETEAADTGGADEQGRGADQQGSRLYKIRGEVDCTFPKGW